MGSHPPTGPVASLSTPCPLDDHGALAADAPCVACGYNLRGLTPAGRCPECGTPVGQSVCGELLRCAPPPWIARLHSGLGSLALALLLLPGPLLLPLLIGPQPSRKQAAVAVDLVLMTLLGVIGLALVTATRPGAPLSRTGLAARICVLLWAAVAPFTIYGLYQGRQAILLGHIVYLVVLGAAWATCFLHLGAVFGMSAPRLALTARILSWASAAVALPTLGSLLLVLAEGQTRNLLLKLAEAGSDTIACSLDVTTWLAAIVWAFAAWRFVGSELAIARVWLDASGRRGGA